MSTARIRCYPLSIAFATALLAGCGGAQPIGAPGAMAGTLAAAAHADRGTSWMLPEAKKIKALIYASDGNVDVYDYDTGKHVGSLTGFNNPYGQCVDKRGDVFLTTSIGSEGAVLEYAHGGSSPMKTFDTDGNPIGCSISPVNGDLAVDNGIDGFGGGSDVQIWKNASGTPTRYTNEQDCNQVWPPGYDNKGNLYIETGNYHSVCEFPAGGSSLVAAEFNHDIGFPGSVMWDGKYLAFTDQSYPGPRKVRTYTSAIYRVKEMRGVLNVVGTTLLRYKPWGTSIIQPFIVGDKNTPANDVEGKVVRRR
ncbi:MAG TPA: WD40 repeat domain-containing protein [Candidatus Cybelea sp.]